MTCFTNCSARTTGRRSEATHTTRNTRTIMTSLCVEAGQAPHARCAWLRVVIGRPSRAVGAYISCCRRVLPHRAGLARSGLALHCSVSSCTCDARSGRVNVIIGASWSASRAQHSTAYPTSRVLAIIARRTWRCIVAILVLKASSTLLNAYICIGTRCSRITIVIKLAGIATGDTCGGSQSSVGADWAAYTCSCAIAIDVGLTCSALYTRGDIVCGRSIPRGACSTCHTWRGCVNIVIKLSRSTLFAHSRTAACVHADVTQDTASCTIQVQVRTPSLARHAFADIHRASVFPILTC